METKPTITIDDVNKLDVRVGTIVRATAIRESESIVELDVDFGDERRTILAGMKEEREDLSAVEGRQTLFIVNLEPRKMMGRTSEGMLFDLGYADGIKPALAVPEWEVPNGTRAG